MKLVPCAAAASGRFFIFQPPPPTATAIPTSVCIARFQHSAIKTGWSIPEVSSPDLGYQLHPDII